jgi:predicted 3-demethylubiquinone-9 3-methyltransferase (glyoxalase superfamily)
MLTITPFLWFDTQAEEAVNLYASIFPRSKIVATNRAQGTVVSVECELEGQKLVAFNAGPHFKFNESISFLIACETQEQIDELWEKLTAGGGEPGRCGWLKDKFGLSWQVVPKSLSKLMSGGEPAGTKRVMDALFSMNKLDAKRLQQAYEGA